MNDRTPPQDFDAEQAVLGAMMLSPSAIEVVSGILRPADFYRPAHEQIFHAILALHASGTPADPRLLLDELRKRDQLVKVGGGPYLHTLLASAPVAHSAEHYAAIVADTAGRRHLIEEGQRMQQEAYESGDPYEAILERTEARLARVPAADSGSVDSLQTLDEFLGETYPEPDWVLEGYLARGERAVITGIEGLGKTTLIRQLAICAAAGIDPFTGRSTKPMTVLAVDCENPRFIAQKRYAELRKAVNAHGHIIASNRFWMEMRPEGMDLGNPGDVRWLQRRMKVVRPDLLVIGPAYKMHTADDDSKDETIARVVTGILDRLRAAADCALILEHHSGNEQGGHVRQMRPYGSSLWRRWPEFGYGIRPAKPPRGMSEQEAERRRLVDLVPWRGARDQRGWPKQMESGGAGLPWVETVVEAA